MTHWFNTFRIRLTILFGGMALILGLGLAFYVNQVASARVTEARGEVIDGVTRAIASALAANLTEREREVVLLSQSPFLMQGDLGSQEVRDALDRIMAAYRYYAWVGITDDKGIVRSSARGLLQGQDVSQRPWYAKGREGPFLGDVHEAVLLAKLLEQPDPTEPLRFVDFATPILDEAGELRGVLATHAHWTWVTETVRDSLPDDSERIGMEVLVINGAGEILYPYGTIGTLPIPSGGIPLNDHAVIEWGGQGRYLTSASPVQSATVTDLGWRVIVRQPVETALAPVTNLHHTLLLISAIAAILFMAIAYRLAVAVSRPIERLHRAARRISEGNEAAPINCGSSVKEVEELTDALQAMTHTLIGRKRKVEDINAQLEQTVLERTSQLLAANKRLERLARTDALTELNNRLAADERLRAEFLRSKRSKSEYSVLLMDLDHFKQINDRHGHEGGDRALQAVAALLQSAMRETDFLARFGGEEFIAILPETDRLGAVEVAEKLRRTLNRADIPPAGHVTLSIGAATSNEAEEDEQAVVRLADAALYRAKETGRNRVVAHSAPDR